MRKVSYKMIFDNCKIIAFLFGIILVFIYILPGSMLDVSGDSADIWQTITTLDSENTYGSYVLYKGFNAIYPYYWLYKLALLIGIDEESFIKMFYAFAFSYTTVLGFPNLFETITAKRVNVVKRIIISVLCFYFWLPNGAITEMMVDLPCLMYFIIMLNYLCRIIQGEKKITNYIVAGFFAGLSLTVSGQYSLPTYIALLLVIIYIIKYNKNNIIYKGSLLIFPAIVVKMYNAYFLHSFVNRLRTAGSWIPDAKTWLVVGFPRFSHLLSMDSRIYTNRIYDLFLQYYGVEDIELTSGALAMSPLEYIIFVLRHLPSFIVAYFNSFFLILSPDGGSFNVLKACIFYTAVFLFLLYMKKSYEDKKVFVIQIALCLVMVAAIIPAIVLVIEQRYCMQIQGFVLTVAISGCGCGNLLECSSGYLKKDKIIKGLVVYTLFVLGCLIHLATLYDANYFINLS